MKKILVVCSMLLCGLACYYISLPDAPTFLGVQALSEEAFAEKTTAYEQVDFEDVFAETLLFETAQFVYEQTYDCYFISVGESIRGDFVTEKGVRLYWIGETVPETYETTMAENGLFTLLIIQEEVYAIVSLKVTTLPLIEMTVEDIPDSREAETTSGTMTVITPYTQQDAAAQELPTYLSEVYYFNIRVRGQTSSAFRKKSYKINLIDENGERAEDDIFGMRKDNDWTLTAMYSDTTRVRDASCFALYQQLADLESTEHLYPQEAVYCEVILNGEYLGLYLFAEHMDTKQLEVNEETDFVYKTLSPFMPYVEELASYLDGTYPEDNQRIELKNVPEGQEALAYELLEEYLTVLPYHSWNPAYSLDAGEEGVSIAAVESVADLDNIIDVSIFKLCLNLWDNDAKNMMLSAELQEDGSYAFYKNYFDFNYSFGDIYISDYSVYFTQESEASDIALDYIVAYLLNGEDADEVIALYQARYEELRSTVFSEENILAVIAENRAQVDHSGAYLREIEAWNYEVDLAAENERMVNYVSERLVFADEYVANLGQEDAA